MTIPNRDCFSPLSRERRMESPNYCTPDPNLFLICMGKINLPVDPYSVLLF
jgi:hypothetical protein